VSLNGDHFFAEPLIVRTLLESPWTITTGACLTALALWHAPEGLTQRVHALTGDALRPGWQLTQYLQQSATIWMAARSAGEAAQLRDELARTQTALRDATERMQRLSAQLAMSHVSPSPPALASTTSETERLFVPALVEAAVLSESTSQAWRDGRVLDRGWKHGVREAALVLQGRGPLIDLGAAAQINPEDTLLVGRTIVGKVTVVGRWTSVFLPVTDPEYRGRAHLVRDTESGPIWGAQGLLRGDGGNRCRLDGVPVEEAVRVGDLVYSAERDGALSAPLAYGRVIEASASPDDREWTLIVEPTVMPDSTTHVHVLRAALNPSRFWTN
jgi:cell shape-determining protein MreC